MKTTTMRERVERYIAARRALGYLFAHSGELRRFARFADESGHQGPVSTELALRWARSSPCSRLYQARKLEQVRCCARFLAPLERGTEVPLPGLLGPAHRRSQPHIFAPQEIAALLAAAAALPPIDGLRPKTYSTLMGLLTCTGLRPGEALRLDRDDVDAPARLLRIRRTKFGKSRLVPMHPSASRMLVRYATFRDQYLKGLCCPRFFVSERGTPLHPVTVRSTFRELRRAAGLCDPAQARAPRLYDFRHTFACRRLTAWYRQGGNTEQLMGCLATYLGHVKVTDTYWYLTGIPELLGIAARRFERFAGSDSRGGR